MVNLAKSKSNGELRKEGLTPKTILEAILTTRTPFAQTHNVLGRLIRIFSAGGINSKNPTICAENYLFLGQRLFDRSLAIPKPIGVVNHRFFPDLRGLDAYAISEATEGVALNELEGEDLRRGVSRFRSAVLDVVESGVMPHGVFFLDSTVYNPETNILCFKDWSQWEEGIPQRSAPMRRTIIIAKGLEPENYLNAGKTPRHVIPSCQGPRWENGHNPLRYGG
jgi:hypothetical protein